MILLFNVFSRLPEFYSLISLGAAFFYLKPVQALNFAVQQDPDVTLLPHAHFSFGEVVVLVLGGLIWWLIGYSFLVEPL